MLRGYEPQKKSGIYKHHWGLISHNLHSETDSHQVSFDILHQLDISNPFPYKKIIPTHGGDQRLKAPASRNRSFYFGSQGDYPKQVGFSSTLCTTQHRNYSQHSKLPEFAGPSSWAPGGLQSFAISHLYLHRTWCAPLPETGQLFVADTNNWVWPVTVPESASLLCSRRRAGHCRTRCQPDPQNALQPTGANILPNLSARLFPTSFIDFLQNKIQELHVRSTDWVPNVIAFTETWGKQWIKDTERTITGYLLFREDYTGGRKEADVAIFINMPS